MLLRLRLQLLLSTTQVEAVADDGDCCSRSGFAVAALCSPMLLRLLVVAFCQWPLLATETWEVAAGYVSCIELQRAEKKLQTVCRRLTNQVS